MRIKEKNILFFIDRVKKTSDREEPLAAANFIATLARLDLEPIGVIADVFRYTKAYAPECVKEGSRYQYSYYTLLRDNL